MLLHLDETTRDDFLFAASSMRTILLLLVNITCLNNDHE